MSKTKLAFILSVVLWAVVVVALLLTVERPQETTVVTKVAAETVVEPFDLVVEEEEDPVEEVDDQIDLKSLNRIENAKITAYCICKVCCGKDESHPDYGITASGRKAEPLLSVAVDPARIPLGSTVYIDYGDGELHEFRADDTGSAVSGAHVDVCYPDHESALEHGVKTARVYWEEKR